MAYAPNEGQRHNQVMRSFDEVFRLLRGFDTLLRLSNLEITKISKTIEHIDERLKVLEDAKPKP